MKGLVGCCCSLKMLAHALIGGGIEKACLAEDVRKLFLIFLT